MRTALVITGVVVAVVYFGAFMFVYKKVRKRWPQGASWDGWRVTARGLPWADRIRIARANSRGRPASPRLATLAVTRGLALSGLIERHQPNQKIRLARRALAAFGVLLIVFNVLSIQGGENNASHWFPLVGWTILSPTLVLAPLIQRRRLRRVKQSIAANEVATSS